MSQSVPAYIGISGVTARKHVDDTLSLVPKDWRGRKLAFGVQTSHESINGLPLPSKWRARMPAIGDISNIFRLDPRAINVVHYSIGAEERDEFDEIAFDDLLKLAFTSRCSYNVFQLNFAWPRPEMLEKFHRLIPFFHFVLQIGDAAIRQAGGEPEKVANRLKPYESLVDYVLLDPSCGNAKLLDVRCAQKFLRAFRRAGLPFRPVVARGLGPKTVEILQPLVAEFPDLSWDAEGALRDKHNCLDRRAVAEYVKKSFAL